MISRSAVARTVAISRSAVARCSATSWSVVVRSWVVSRSASARMLSTSRRLLLRSSLASRSAESRDAFASRSAAVFTAVATARAFSTTSFDSRWAAAMSFSASRLDSPRCSFACSSARRSSCSTRVPRPDSVGWARSSSCLDCSATLRSSSEMRSRASVVPVLAFAVVSVSSSMRACSRSMNMSTCVRS